MKRTLGIAILSALILAETVQARPEIPRLAAEFQLLLLLFQRESVHSELQCPAFVSFDRLLAYSNHESMNNVFTFILYPLIQKSRKV